MGEYSFFFGGTAMLLSLRVMHFCIRFLTLVFAIDFPFHGIVLAWDTCLSCYNGIWRIHLMQKRLKGMKKFAKVSYPKHFIVHASSIPWGHAVLFLSSN